jgi:hypothetical protein
VGRSCTPHPGSDPRSLRGLESAIRGAASKGHGREARKRDASVASGGKRLPMRLTLPVCSSGSEPLGTMRTALPSLGR